jgi:hypothetical protein
MAPRNGRPPNRALLNTAAVALVAAAVAAVLLVPQPFDVLLAGAALLAAGACRLQVIRRRPTVQRHTLTPHTLLALPMPVFTTAELAEIAALSDDPPVVEAPAPRYALTAVAAERVG